MSNLKKYVKKMRTEDKRFARDYEFGYEHFKSGRTAHPM